MKGPEVKRHSKESALYHQQLESYISTYLSQGYSPTELEAHLLHEGYDAHSVREALKKVNRTYYQGKLEIHATSHQGIYLIVVLLSLIAFSVLAYTFFSTTTFSSYEFYINLENDETYAYDLLQFNIATTKEVDATILIQTKEGKFVLEQQDVFSESSLYAVLLPEDVPIGEYVVDVFVTYKGSKEQYSFPFRVLETSTIPETQTPSGLVTQNPSDQDLSLLTRAVNSRNSLDCARLTSSTYKDECYFAIARETLNEQLCESIVSGTKRDNCYLSQVLGGNSISCQVIEHLQIREVCESIIGT